MKKLFALLLALVMVFGLGVTAYAEDNSAAMDELIVPLDSILLGYEKRTISACPPVRSPRRSRKRTASPLPTSGSAAPTTPMTTLPRRGCWSSTTR